MDWFTLTHNNYVRITPASDGTLRSEAFPGLWLDPQSLLKGDLPAILAVLDQSTATAEHAFAKRLKA